MNKSDAIYRKGGIIWAIALAIVAIIMSGIAIATDYPRKDISMDYLGIIIGITSLLVTALLGWQIFNAIEMRTIIKDYNRLKNQLDESNKELKVKDAQNIALIEAYAKFNNATDGDYPFSRQYEIYLEALELFLKANMPLRYNSIIEINAILSMMLTSLKRGVVEEKRQFIENEKNFDGLYHNILNHLGKRKDDTQQLSSKFTSIHDKRVSICQKIRNEISSMDSKTKQDAEDNNSLVDENKSLNNQNQP